MRVWWGDVMMVDFLSRVETRDVYVRVGCAVSCDTIHIKIPI